MDMKEKVYLFKVTLQRPGPKIYREMELKGASSLYEFAEVITGAFDFDLDHAFGFYSDIYHTDDSEEAYTLFYDTDSIVPEPNEKSVERNYVYNVFEPGRIMLFLFDYGVSWEFLVKCYAVSEAEPTKTYPAVTKKVGQSPKQYIYSDDED